jgi:hypothetical protein
MPLRRIGSVTRGIVASLFALGLSITLSGCPCFLFGLVPCGPSRVFPGASSDKAASPTPISSQVLKGNGTQMLGPIFLKPGSYYFTVTGDDNTEVLATQPTFVNGTTLRGIKAGAGFTVGYDVSYFFWVQQPTFKGDWSLTVELMSVGS